MRVDIRNTLPTLAPPPVTLGRKRQGKAPLKKEKDWEVRHTAGVEVDHLDSPAAYRSCL